MLILFQQLCFLDSKLSETEVTDLDTSNTCGSAEYTSPTSDNQIENSIVNNKKSLLKEESNKKDKFSWKTFIFIVLIAVSSGMI